MTAAARGELWTLIQAHLDRFGVREAEFARRIGAAPQTVNSWKKRGLRKLPGRRLLDAVAELTATPYSALLAATLVDIGYLDAVPPADEFERQQV